jgi:hypothetical protein
MEFPHPTLETVVVQWENQRPSLFIQLGKNPEEPLQFPEKRPPAELQQQLRNFLNPSNAQPFTDFAWLADIVFSARAFTFLQPEPDSVLDAQTLWECRAEALSALKLEDAPLEPVAPTNPH